jgi:class 3 adenylate cyclase
MSGFPPGCDPPPQTRFSEASEAIGPFSWHARLKGYEIDRTIFCLATEYELMRRIRDFNSIPSGPAKEAEFDFLMEVINQKLEQIGVIPYRNVDSIKGKVEERDEPLLDDFKAEGDRNNTHSPPLIARQNPEPRREEKPVGPKTEAEKAERKKQILESKMFPRRTRESEKPQERLMAVLSAGARGYTRLMHTDEREAFQRLMACREAMFGLIATYRGRVAITTGDSLLAEFARAEDALAAAVAIQESLAVLNEPAPVERRMMFGIGINHGYVIVREGNILGSVVNIAERLQSAANAGETYVSIAAVEQVRENHDQKFVHLGALRFRGIDAPVEVYTVWTGA